LATSAHSTPSLRWRWLLPVVLLVVAFQVSPVSTALNRAFFDAASRHPFRAPPVPANSAIVLINDDTLQAMSAQGVRWPFPRLVFAQLVAALDRAGAEKIVFDFTFFEESAAAEEDQLLAAVAAASPGLVLARTADRAPVFWTPDFVSAHPEFFRQPRTGLVEFPADSDGVARSYVLPQSLAAFGAADAGPGGLLRWNGGLDQVIARGVPLLSAAPFIEAGRPIVSRIMAAAPDLDAPGVARALAAEPPPEGNLVELVRGRVVFVGANASGTFDLKPLPVGQVEPGLLVHWTAWANRVSGGFIAAASRPALFAAALAAGLAVLLFGINRTALLAPLATAVVAVVLLLAGSWMLLSAGWFLPPATPLAATVLVLLGVIIENFWREQRRKREIQAMFGAYVDPGVVAQLVRNPEAIALRGERREATVFFSDLAGFTDLSEKLADSPERMVEVVNAYLEETSECLHRHGAYVDKYIGDAVMAVLGAPAALPDHALAACRASLEAQAALAGINARYAAPIGVKLEVRIGLNTGDMIVGNLGSSRKKQYTVMGDAVNLASRLEGANKYFGTGILLGEETAKRVQATMVTRPLARLRVKGKAQAVEVHTLHGATGTLPAAENEFVAAYRAGYTACVEHRFAAALPDLARALALRPDDPSTQRWHTAATTFVSTPPPPHWEPIVSLDSK